MDPTRTILQSRGDGQSIAHYKKSKRILDLGCVGPSTFGVRAKASLHAPKAVTYHEQYRTLYIIQDRSHYCRFTIGQSKSRIEIL